MGSDGAFTALAGYAKGFTHLGDSAGTLLDCRFDLTISNTFAQTNVHKFPDKDCLHFDQILVQMRIYVNNR